MSKLRRNSSASSVAECFAWMGEFDRVFRLQARIRSHVNDGPVTTYHAGESISEFPHDRHRVSENASTTEPPRLLAVFVVDTEETVLTTP